MCRIWKHLKKGTVKYRKELENIMLSFVCDFQTVQSTAGHCSENIAFVIVSLNLSE